MKKKLELNTVIAIISCVLLVILSVRVIALKDRINQLENNLFSRIDSINSNISYIESRITGKLEEQGNAFSDFSYEFGEPSADLKSVIVRFNATPKEYSPEQSKVQFLLGDKLYAMTLENGVYTAELSLPIAENSFVSSICITTNGITQAQVLNEYIEPRYNCLPMVYGRAEGNISLKKNGRGAVLSYKGLAHIDCELKGGSFQFEKLEYVALVNGEEAARETVDMSYKAQEGYIDTFCKGTNTHICMPDAQSYPEEAFVYYYYLDESFELKDGDTLELFIDATDDKGFVYRALFDAVEFTNGSFEYIYFDYIGAEPSIYDKNGELIFDVRKIYS